MDAVTGGDGGGGTEILSEIGRVRFEGSARHRRGRFRPRERDGCGAAQHVTHRIPSGRLSLSLQHSPLVLIDPCENLSNLQERSTSDTEG